MKIGFPARWLLLLALFSCATGSGLDDTPSRRYRFTYTARIPAAPGTKMLEIWIPLPRTDPGVQELSEERIEGPAGWEITKDRVYGNRMIHCRVASPAPVTNVQWSCTVTRFEDRGQGTLAGSPRFLLPNNRIPLDGKATSMAEAIGVANSELPVEDRAKRIYDDVLVGMSYDKNHEGWGQGDFEHAVTECKGNCTDFHSRFVGIGRAAGIPVRFTMGIPMQPSAKGEYDSYHCWAHYHDGTSWHPVDISEADKVADRDPARARWFFGNLDTNRIGLTFGRDLILEPAQGGPPLNYFVFPYAEADGQIVRMSKDANWKFTYEDV